MGDDHALRLTGEDVRLIVEGPGDDTGGDDWMPMQRPLLRDGEEMRHSMGLQRRLLVVLLCAPLLGFFGVVAAEAVSNHRIAEHLLDAESAGILGPSITEPSPLGTAPARYTECTSFSLGLGTSTGENMVSAAMLGTAYTGCDRLGAALTEFHVTGAFHPGFPYLRYWHGYAVFTRPSLGVLGVAGTRWIAFAGMTLVVAGLTVAVKRSFGTVAAALIAVPTMLTTDVVIGSQSVSSAIGTGSAWLGGWLAFLIVSRQPEWRVAALITAIAGAISAYFDLLTTIPGSFALAVIGATLGAAAAGVDPARPRAWRLTGAAAIGWLAGLVWMWGSKWILASVILGLDEVVNSVTSQIGFRVSSGTYGVTDSRVRGLTINLAEWWGQPLTPWVVFGTLATLVVATLRGRRSPAALARIALCCGIVVLPVLGWYAVLNNHSQIHPLLVYRSLPIAFGAVAALWYVASRNASGRSPEPLGNRFDDVARTADDAASTAARTARLERTSDAR
jgi:hypothetical protein